MSVSTRDTACSAFFVLGLGKDWRNPLVGPSSPKGEKQLSITHNAFEVGMRTGHPPSFSRNDFGRDSESARFFLPSLSKTLDVERHHLSGVKGGLARYASRFSVRALDLTVDSTMLWVGAGLALGAAVLLAFVPGLPSSDRSN
jgi:hypothetical protein